MSVLYVTEFSGVASSQLGGSYTQVSREPPLADQTVAIGVSSVASAAFNTSTTLIRVHTDAICSVAIGATPTAAATNRRMAANQTEYFGVPQGLNFKIAVINNT
jgi:hypothetical protein